MDEASRAGFADPCAVLRSLAGLIACCSAGFAMVGMVLLSPGCDGEQRPAQTLTPIARVAADFFPVTVVVEPDKAWLTVGSVTRVEEPEGHTEATLTFEGTIRVISAGTFDYRLTVTDSEGKIYEDSGGIRMGEREEGENPAYQTSIAVPSDARLARLGFWIAGANRPELSYIIDLPVEGVPARRE